jgi:hypothetical protein
MKFNIGIKEIIPESKIYALYFQKSFLCFCQYEGFNVQEEYSLIIRMADFPLVKSYRNRYRWFKDYNYFIQLIGSGIEEDVFLNMGNLNMDKSKSLIIGLAVDMTSSSEISQLPAAMNRFYGHVYPLLEKRIGDFTMAIKNVIE